MILNKIFFIIFLSGETNIKNSKEVIEYVKLKINGDILDYDISISTEDKLKLFKKMKLCIKDNILKKF